MMKTKVIWGVFAVVVIVFALSIWTPWHRQPVVFYEPVILPLETIKGDIIVFENGTHIVIVEDKRINSVQHNLGSVTINATIHRSLWQMITNKHQGVTPAS